MAWLLGVTRCIPAWASLAASTKKSAWNKSGSKGRAGHADDRSESEHWDAARSGRAVCCPALGLGCNRRTGIVPLLEGVERMRNPS